MLGVREERLDLAHSNCVQAIARTVTTMQTAKPLRLPSYSQDHRYSDVEATLGYENHGSKQNVIPTFGMCT